MTQTKSKTDMRGAGGRGKEANNLNSKFTNLKKLPQPPTFFGGGGVEGGGVYFFFLDKPSN